MKTLRIVLDESDRDPIGRPRIHTPGDLRWSRDQGDDDAMTVLRAVLHPSFFGSIRAGARSTEQAAELVTAAIVPWFAARSLPRRRGLRRSQSD